MSTGDLRHVRELESLPIDSLWVGGHVASRNPSPEAMMQLARLSANTERVRIGTSILLLPLYPPALVAKQIADLDRASGGRVTLGVGVGGEYPQEFRACGVPVRERGKRIDEAIPLIRRLWSGREISHDGPCYPMTDVTIHPSPAQEEGPPIVVAGRKEAAMRRAATLGDGWMPYLYSPRRYASSVEQISTLAASSGRQLDRFEWFCYLFVNIHTDGSRAREDAARAMGATYNQDLRQLIDRVAAAGTAQEVRDKVQDFADAGARHFIFMPIGPPKTDSVVRELLFEIAPSIRIEERAAPGASPAD